MNDENYSERTGQIRTMNDRFRQSFAGGRVVITNGVKALGDESIPGLVGLVQTYPAEKFVPDNDPYGEHDFGSVDYQGSKYFWKIDYYDRNLEFHSENPADSSLTQRVMTIMRADEY